MGWTYNSGIYAGATVPLFRLNRRLLENCIDKLNDEMKMQFEMFHDDQNDLSNIGLGDLCYIGMEKIEIESFSASYSCSSNSEDDYGNRHFPSYAKKYNGKITITDLEKLYLEKLFNLYNNLEYEVYESEKYVSYNAVLYEIGRITY